MKKDWPTVSIGESCVVSSGGTPSRSNSAYWNGDLPWVSAKDLKSDQIRDAELHISEAAVKQSATKIAPKGSLLVLVRGMGLANGVPIGEVVTPVAFNQDIRAIRPPKEVVPRFLLLALRSALSNGGREDIISSAAHGTLKIDADKLSGIRFPVPPLPEQQRIVGILDKSFEAIATAKANAERSLRAAKAIVPVAFTAIVDSFNPSDWETLTVEQVADAKKGSMRTGPFGSQLLHSEFVDEGIPVLGIDNAVENRFSWKERRYITPRKFKELSRYQVKPRDVLITIMGTCGRCAIVPDDIPTAINSKHLCCITLDSKKCLPEFLHAYFLYHPAAQQFLGKQAKGAIMSGLNMGIIKEVPLILPTVAEQQCIVEKFGAVQEEAATLVSTYQAKSIALDDLKKSLLHQAFSGQL